MRERDIERKLVAGVKRLGGVAYKWVSPGQDGVPDRIVCMPGGKVYFVELKADRGRVSPRQVYQLGRLEKLGFRTFVVWGVDGVNKFLADLEDHADGI